MVPGSEIDLCEQASGNNFPIAFDGQPLAFKTQLGDQLSDRQFGFLKVALFAIDAECDQFCQNFKLQ